MTISVCMGTYNGEKYIQEQLNSIKNQTLPPDEVIICDDGSTDHTVELIHAFFRENGLSGGLDQDGDGERKAETEREREAKPEGETEREREAKPERETEREREAKPEGETEREREAEPEGETEREREAEPKGEKERERATEGETEREREAETEREKEEKGEADKWQDAQGRIWKLFINEKNLGYPACFYYAMSLCRGDIVFLSDQDDIWDVQKLEKMCTVFSKQGTVQALVCKFGLIDGDGNKMKTAMAPTRAGGTAELRKVSVHDVFYKGEWPGMVMAYRREWYERKAGACWERILTAEEYKGCSEAEAGQDRESGKSIESEQGKGPEKSIEPEQGKGSEKSIEPEQGRERDKESEPKVRKCFSGYQQVLPHDLLVGAWAAEEGAFRQLDEELAWHRRHENNAGQEEHKIRKLLNKERKLREIETYLRYLEVFDREGLMETQEGQRTLDEKLQSMFGRYEALRSGKIGRILGNALKNRKSVRLATVACDLVICRQKVIGEDRS